MTFDFKEFFPFEEIREQQSFAIEKILEAFERKKFVILQAGTGCGKSALALTTGRYLQNRTGLNGSVFITTQKILQAQYEKDFCPPNGEMVSLSSSSNYNCSYFKGKVNCKDARALLKTQPPNTPFSRNCNHNCEYIKKRGEFLTSGEAVTNSSFFLLSLLKNKNIMKEFLVIDEAHTIEQKLSEFIEITISEYFCQKVLNLEFPSFDKINTSIRTIDWIKNVFNPNLNKKLDNLTEIVSRIEKIDNNKNLILRLTGMGAEKERISEYLRKIKDFHINYNKDDWILNHINDDGKRKIQFKPISVEKYAQSVLFAEAKKVLLMSATIIDKDVFAESLGITDYEFIDIPSPFGVNQKPILYFPVGKMSINEIDNTLPKLGEMIKQILEIHKKEKGVIHTHSFKILNFLKNFLPNHPRLLIQENNGSQAILEAHKATLEPTVLVSPSMDEGVDLKDNLSRFQIICKIPFPYLGDKFNKARMKKQKKWYAFSTIKKIVQAVGRSIRNENDYAITYILDENWEYFYEKNKELFPEDFRKSLK